MAIMLTGGKLGRRKLLGPPGNSVRPAAARIRQALFNHLGPWIEGRRVLDLYAGVGLYGIEALARGGTGLTFVERNTAVAQVLGRNLQRVNCDDARVMVRPVARALGQLAKEEAWDLIIADPPYGQGAPQWLLQQEALRGLLSDEGFLVLEHEPGALDSLPSEWVPLRCRDYGASTLSILRKA